MADPIALQIVDAIRDRLELITLANGYNTEPTVLAVGQQPALSEHFDTDYVVSLFEQPDTPDAGDLQSKTLVTMQVVVEGAAKFGESDENTILYRLWQDICKAVFKPDTTLGGLAAGITRGPKGFVYSQSGEGVTGVRQVVNVQYFETFGNP